MTDKAHCKMHPDDEDEYEEFYDFSKTYENHPDSLKNPELKQKRERPVKQDGVDEPWEDVDFESGDEDIEDEEEEETKDNSEKTETKIDGE